MERSVVATTPPPFNDIPPPSNPARSFQLKSALKDVSFSPSYLRPDRPAAAATAAFEPLPSSRLPRRMVVNADDAELSIFDAEKYFNETSEQKQLPPSLERIADKNEFDRASSVSSSVDGYGRNYKNGSYHATPTASSEASWNSQSGLLTNSPGTIVVSMRKSLHLDDGGKKGPCSPCRWLFRRKCPCSGYKSVDVKEKFSQSRNQIAHTHHTHNNNNNSELIKVIPTDHHQHHRKLETEEDQPTMAKMRVSAQSWAKDEQLSYSNLSSFASQLGPKVAYSARRFLSDAGGFAFPVINPPSSTLTDSAMRAPVNSPEDPPRVSLEVFRPSLQLADEEVRLSRQEAAHAYPCDVGRRSFSFAASPRRRVEDDVASDSSSDLFELESFSTSTGTGAGWASAAMYRRRDSLDELVRYGGGPPSSRRSLDDTSTTVTLADVAAAEAYEPSEASVEWSVVTADAFDRNSLANFSASASEFGELARLAVQEEGVEGGGRKKGAGGGLLNCRCEKAVSVGPHPVRSAYHSQVMESSGARVSAAVMARVAAANIRGGGGVGNGGAGGGLIHAARPQIVASNINSFFSSPVLRLTPSSTGDSDVIASSSRPCV